MSVFDSETHEGDRANSTIDIVIDGWESGAAGPLVFQQVEPYPVDPKRPELGKVIEVLLVGDYQVRPQTLQIGPNGDVLEVRVGQVLEDFHTGLAIQPAVRVTVSEGTTRDDARRLLNEILVSLDTALDKARLDWDGYVFQHRNPDRVQHIQNGEPPPSEEA